MSDIGRAERWLADDRGRRADHVEIRGLRVDAHHGVHEKERREGQPFIVDVVLDIDTKIAARTDQLDDTIDYTQLVVDIAEIVRSTQFNLLEALAGHVADQLLRIPRVAAASVRICKPEVELAEPVDAVAVQVHRARPVHIT
ncbi:MAG: dihydroneopterin aldolase [Actinobacteria bacterium]|nr:dihydroneopterin aldolase [Actinomycetota bacterium]